MAGVLRVLVDGDKHHHHQGPNDDRCDDDDDLRSPHGANRARWGGGRNLPGPSHGYRTRMTPRIRLGGILLGAGVGGFLTGTVVSQVLRWQFLADGTAEDGRSVTDLHGLAVAASVVQLSIWILAVAGVGLLWYGSDRGDRQLPWRAVAGWALIGWGVVTAVLGLADSIVAVDSRRALDGALVVAGLLLVGAGWRLATASAR